MTVVVIPAHVVPAAPRPGAEAGRGSALPRRAAAVVEHGSVAPCSWQQAPPLDPGWTVERAAALPRQATGPGGQTAEVVDHLLLIRRTR
ncbi:hypothetical protein [Amycolatopsis sp. NPDC004169]|uniref:hypothetical protein n=1 Tax=Amycolatopsis sp. NPDC004169 TaxID=3154453 RepID=UPI0033BE3CB6